MQDHQVSLKLEETRVLHRLDVQCLPPGPQVISEPGTVWPHVCIALPGVMGSCSSIEPGSLAGWSHILDSCPYRS